MHGAIIGDIINGKHIHDYIASPDIAAHCKAIGHVFNPLEMSVIIEHSGIAAEEKHAAWLEIIERHPDMPIHRSRGFEPKDSLHAYLKEKMAFEESLFREFCTPGLEDGIIYRPYIFRPAYEASQIWFGSFSTYEKAIEAARVVSEEELLGRDKGNTRIVIDKEYIDRGQDDEELILEAHFSLNGALQRILAFGLERPDYLLRNVSIRLPLPFGKGDVVTFYKGEPYVLDGVFHCYTGEGGATIRRESGEIGDGSELIPFVYHLDSNGKPQYGKAPGSLYLMRYYRGELEEGYEPLELLSAFLKAEAQCIESKAAQSATEKGGAQ